MVEHVNHPSHYNKPGQKECIVAMEEEFGAYAVYNFCLCNAYKYRYRAGEKDGNPQEQDLKKAEWYENYAENIKVRRPFALFTGTPTEGRCDP